MTTPAGARRADARADPGAAFPPLPRSQIMALGASRIRDIANGAMGRNDVAAFWFGESDTPTPGFIREAAVAALARGETFYSHNLGTPELRAQLSVYLSRLHGADIGPERLAVTSSGVSGLMLTAQMLVSPGDRVAVVTPVWPNVAELPRILGAEMVRVPLAVTGGRWQLDLDRLRAALTPDTRALYLNSPNNPTGWTIDADTLAAVLEHCRRFGIWLITDDVYERLTFGNRPAAPSVLPIADPSDRVISVNSFSKAWSMTGWRLGWAVAPPPFVAEMAKVIEYNTSCAPAFVQSAALAALQQEAGEQAIAELRARLGASRDLLMTGLRQHAAAEVPEAEGAMYAFFRIAGRSDDMALARRLLDVAGLGLAPGSAFGPEGAGWLRWCFAARPEKIADGLDRLGKFLQTERL
ncbi:MAG: pyridoxal phosphate-dependent aminotransferase [Devosia sp.]|nr:pyridoxal phosphate-dependent aminotransferase [Devosia sp.]